MERRKRGISILLVLVLIFGTITYSHDVMAESEPLLVAEPLVEAAGETSVYGHLPITKKDMGQEDSQTAIQKRSVASSLESFSLLDEGRLSPVRDQEELGMCWTFATLGAGESSYWQEDSGDSQLSTWHLAYSGNNQFMDPLGLRNEDYRYMKSNKNSIYDAGGNWIVAVNSLTSSQGAVDEELAPYPTLQQKLDEEEDASLPDEYMYQKTSRYLTGAEVLSVANPDAVKEKIVNDGAGVLSIHAPETEEENDVYWNDGRTAYCVSSDSYENYGLEENHDVVVVGWDDNYSRSNFNAANRPVSNGAWLIRNSWGSDAHDEGYFWLSYEDGALEADGEVAFIQMESSNDYDNNYQYDSGSTIASITSDGVLAAANVFTAKSKSEKVEAVSFWTWQPNMDYTCQIYKNLTDTTNPESGQLVSEKSGTFSYKGYHTIVPDAEIALTKGDTFAAVVSLSDPEGQEVASYVVEYDSFKVDGCESHVAAEENQSFMKRSNGTWTDVCDSFQTPLNNRIKVITSDAVTEECEYITSENTSVTVGVGENTLLAYKFYPENTSGTIYWKSENESIARVSGGIVYGVSEGTTSITGTVNGETLTIQVAVGEQALTTPTPTASTEVSPTPTASTEVSPTPTASTEVSPTPTASTEVSPTPTASTEVSPTPTASTEVSPAPTASPIPTESPLAPPSPFYQPDNTEDNTTPYVTVKKPKAPTKVKAKNTKKKKVVLSWKKVSGAKGYQIQYAQNKKFTKKKKSRTTKKTKYTVKKLKKKKTYYFRVRAYKTNAGKKVYGKWSAIKKVKVKK